MARPTKAKLMKDYINHFQHSPQSQAMRKSSLKYFFDKWEYVNGNNKKIHGYKGHIFDITTKKLKDYFTWLKNLDSLSVATKKAKWNILCSFLNFTMEDYNEFLVKIPSKTVNWLGSNGNGEKKKEILTFEEIEAILNYFKPRNMKHYLIFRLFVETGMRKGELINAEYTGLDTKKRLLETKGKRGGAVYYFSKDLADWLNLYCNNRKKINTNDKTLFLTVFNSKYSNRPFNLMLKNACNKLGIEKNVTCHMFRRTINTYRKTKLNCDLENRKILLNHSVSDVNTSNYLVMDYNNFLNMFDKYNPYKELNI